MLYAFENEMLYNIENETSFNIEDEVSYSFEMIIVERLIPRIQLFCTLQIIYIF